MKAIETEYRGYRFRSRLEARWAVFFDALSLPWEYEPEGFELGCGRRYLPDFRVRYPGRGADEVHHEWFEVKSSLYAIGEDEWLRMIDFRRESGLALTILDGTPDMRMYVDVDLACKVEEREPKELEFDESGGVIPGTWTERWSIPDRLTLQKLSQHARWGWLLWGMKGRLWIDDHEACWGPRGICYDADDYRDAVLASRGARFEFGEARGLRT